MSDRTANLIDSVQALRIRNAILVTALRRIGEPVCVSRHHVYEAAAFDVQVKESADGWVVALKDARK